MTCKRIILAAVVSILLSVMPSYAEPTFTANFQDATLRLDLMVSGNATESHVYASSEKQFAGWAGRRTKLTEVPAVGAGQVYLLDRASGELLYRHDFNTLFQEWQSMPEAKTVSRSFESVALVPMPKRPVTVRVLLFDNRRQEKARLEYPVDPNDVQIIHLADKPQFPLVTLHKPANPDRCCHIVYVPEGFTEAELTLFAKRAKEATEAFFKLEPYKSERAKLSFTALMVPSEQSGTTIPQQGIFRKTPLQSSFNTFGMDRYLTTLHLFALHDLLAGTPCEHIIVLVNSTKYGGGGILNFYNLTTTEHNQFLPVCIHEFGHSFAGLADEYAYANEELEEHPLDLEPDDVNITICNDPKQCKWRDLIGTPSVNGGEVGLYEGAGYRTRGMYRPSKDCRMRINECAGFCPVCQRQIKNVIDFYAQ